MHYFILAVSKNKAQLFEVTSDRVLPRGVDGMPISMADAWKGMERESGDHNQRNANDVTEQEENEYMHMIAKSVHETLHAQHDPLVFAGVSEAYGMFKKYDQSGRLLDAFIAGNQDQTPMEDLMAKAHPIVRAEMLRKNAVVLEQFGNLQGTGRTSVDSVEIETSAAAGKVETLLLPEGSMEAHLPLVREVWKHRGAAVVVEASTMPEGSSVAAILRQ